MKFSRPNLAYSSNLFENNSKPDLLENNLIVQNQSHLI